MSTLLAHLEPSDVSPADLSALDELWQSMPDGELRRFIAAILDMLAGGESVTLFTKDLS